MAISPALMTHMKEYLYRNESYRQFPYVDNTGNLTVGIGRNIQVRGLSIAEALVLLDDDIRYFDYKLRAVLAFYDTLAEPRKAVLIDMCFNMGINAFLLFKDMLNAIEKQDWTEARVAMQQSKWATQVGQRAQEDANMMYTGEYNA